MTVLYHIVSAADWAKQENQSDYKADSLPAEGFIHLSTQEQVAGVVERYYQHIPDLLLLHIDAEKLSHPLKYEPATSNELFPHLYGPLNKDALLTVEPYEKAS